MTSNWVRSVHVRPVGPAPDMVRMSTPRQGSPRFRHGYPRCGTLGRLEPGSEEPIDRPGSVGVDQLADRGDLSAQLIVDGGFAGDLVARVQDRGVVPAAQLRPDPQE